MDVIFGIWNMHGRYDECMQNEKGRCDLGGRDEDGRIMETWFEGVD
jgi:hypothetical protein